MEKWLQSLLPKQPSQCRIKCTYAFPGRRVQLLPISFPWLYNLFGQFASELQQRFCESLSGALLLHFKSFLLSSSAQTSQEVISSTLYTTDSSPDHGFNRNHYWFNFNLIHLSIFLCICLRTEHPTVRPAGFHWLTFGFSYAHTDRPHAPSHWHPTRELPVLHLALISPDTALIVIWQPSTASPLFMISPVRIILDTNSILYYTCIPSQLDATCKFSSCATSRHFSRRWQECHLRMSKVLLKIKTSSHLLWKARYANSKRIPPEFASPMKVAAPFLITIPVLKYI